MGTNLLDKTIDNKVSLLTSKLEFILNQIKNRKSIKDYNVNALNYEQAKAQNLIFSLPDYGYKQSMTQGRLDLEKMKIELEQEKRKEIKEFWKDTVSLYNMFIDTLIDYYKVNQRKEMMEYMKIN